MKSYVALWSACVIGCLLRGSDCIKPMLYSVNGATELAAIFSLSETTILCEHPMTIDEVNNDRCTMEEPCIAAINRWDRKDECNQCYKLVYHQNETSNPNCKDNVCPSMRKEAYIKVVEFYGFAPEVMFAVYQQGFHKVCPFACRNTKLCVDSTDQCSSGVYPEEEMRTNRDDISSIMVPGSTLSGRKLVTWEKVVCGTSEPADVTTRK